jgi:thiamine-phosphate pyrophosphorylase
MSVEKYRKSVINYAFSKTKDQIIDVNLNRLSEGLRIIEELVRFYLADIKKLERIRKIKRELWNNLSKVRKEVIWSRKSEQDLGRPNKFDKTKRTGIYNIFTANIKRSQESSRVLEEVFKLDNPKISGFIKKLRFTLYDLEKELARYFCVQFDPKLYVIINTETTGRRNLIEITKACVLAGATMIQLREPKNAMTQQWLLDAKKVKKGIINSRVKLIINDRVDIALADDADGVHLGGHDMPLLSARKLLGDGKIIGVTVKNLAQARKAERQGADYVGVGAIFPSPTKTTAPVVGVNKLKEVLRNVKLPVVAIGGITPQNAKQLFKLGVSGVAVISSVFNSVDFRKRDFAQQIAKNLKKL